jgi:predicted transcriptional regulator
MRRTRIDIINDMLLAIVNKGGTIKPTHLLYKSNLSHTLMKEYIRELISKKLIMEQPEKRGKSFRITDKGRQFSREYKKMKQFQESFGL